MTRAILEVRGLSVTFGGIEALDRVSLDVAEGEIVGLIGPNGAGKTTLFNCLSGLYRPSAGDVRFRGRSLIGRKPHAIAALGVGRTFQNLALFPSLSMIGNVLTGSHARTRAGFVASALGLPRVHAEETAERERATGLLAELGLSAHADSSVSSLPFGWRKQIELARALMGSPALLLLDEPAGGLSAPEVDELAALLAGLRARHALTMMLVEHHMAFVMRLSDRVVALDSGRKIADGSPARVQETPAVIDSYLGLAPA